MLSKRLTGALGAGILALGVAASAAPAEAATFAVVNTNNGGAGSLRSAILAANMTAARDQITFQIPGAGVHTIALAADLPFVTQPVSIRGYSQPGSSVATAAAAANPTIVIDATNAVRGLGITGDEVEVRGLVIQNAQVDGIWATGTLARIAGNYIGTTAGGIGAAPNAEYGVRVDGDDNEIGGPAVADRNVIAGNGFGGVRVNTGTGTVLEGNFLGTGELGLAGLGGGGVVIDSDLTTVTNNLISGNLIGVQVEGDDNTLQGNKIGTDVNGTAAVSNLFGVNVVGGDRNLIGGPAAGNVVSGNSFDGVLLMPNAADPAEDNEVESNLLGTDVNGAAALPNDYGVRIIGSNNNHVSDGNVISGNQLDGVKIESEGADDNQVVANFIGTDAAGMLALGNGESGVEIDDGDQNEVGDAQGLGNTIAYNGSDGVTVTAGSGNAIRRNSILDNGLLGIDLGADGATANDFLDADQGANQLQNGPVIDAADPVDVTWELDSVPVTDYRLEFYTSASCDPSGSGEGETYLATRDVTTDANGHADGVEPVAPGSGVHVTMTATRLAGQAVRSTSELSPCRFVP
jgi:hypothetical protein